MKKLILAVALLIGFSSASQAQNDTMKMEKKVHKTVKKTKVTKTRKVATIEGALKEGVMMKDNQMMRCHDHQWTLLSETYTCANGTKIATDGSVSKADGSTMKLVNGQGFSESGKMIDKSKSSM